ncbi:hypothetical protein IT568_08160 [bacterium]|nr:hypothetical protein [bacterium]
MKKLILVIFCFVLFACEKQDGFSDKVTLVYSTNVHGLIEPCSCKEKQVGGLPRRVTAIDSLRKANKSILVLDSGDLLFKNRIVSEFDLIQDKIKAETLAEGFVFGGIDVMNVGDYELAAGIDFVKSLETKFKMPYVSCNLIDEKGKLLFEPFKVFEFGSVKIGVFGVTALEEITSRETKRILNHEPVTASKIVVEALKKKNCNVIIGLLDVYQETVKKILMENPEINFAIVTDNFIPNGKVEFTKKQWTLKALDEGKHLGILTFNAAEKESLSSFISSELILEPEIPDNPKMAELLKKAKEIINSKEETVRSELLTKGNFLFVTEKKCKTCHLEQHEFWKTTRHANAYQTLREKKQHLDNSCIGCHTTGYGKEGGFIRPIEVGNFANVQCEMCHGVGQFHVGKDKMIVRKPEEKTCLSCHEVDHTDYFNYKEYLPLISCTNAKK